MNFQPSIPESGSGDSSAATRRSGAPAWLLWALLPLLTLTLWAGASVLHWNQPTTILLLGSDSRYGKTPARSDSIFVLHADPERRTLRGLSLPRDLYVPLTGLPVSRTDRINSAMFYGSYYSQDNSIGVRVAHETISDLTGVPIEGALVIHFDLIRRLVDAIGGVDVYCEKTVRDPAFFGLTGGPSYEVRFEKGWNHIDGRNVTDFARVRKNDTDFGRMGRNRELITAVMQRLRSPAAWFRLPLALTALPGNIESDVRLTDLPRIAWVLARCSRNGIEWDTIERSEVLPYVTSRGAQVLLPEPGILRDAGRILVGQEPMRVADIGTDLTMARP